VGTYWEGSARFARKYRYCAAFTAALCVISVPGVILPRELLDVPGKNLVVVALEFPLNRTTNQSHASNTLGIAILDRRTSMQSRARSVWGSRVNRFSWSMLVKGSLNH